MSKGSVTTLSMLLAALTILFSFFVFSSKRWIDNVDAKISKIDRIEVILDQVWSKVQKLP